MPPVTVKAPVEQEPKQEEKPQATPPVLDGADIPEAFRGKPVKEVLDQLLLTNVELEKLKTALEQERLEKQKLAEEAKKVQVPPQELSEEELVKKQEEEFFKNPIAFQNKLFAERMKPLISQFYQSQEQIQRDLAKRRLDDFDKYEKEIDEIMKTIPPDLRANPQTWDMAYNLALGKEYRNKLKESKAKTGLHIESSSTAPTTPSKPELTDEERRVAAQFGMTEEEWIKWREE